MFNAILTKQQQASILKKKIQQSTVIGYLCYAYVINVWCLKKKEVCKYNIEIFSNKLIISFKNNFINLVTLISNNFMHKSMTLEK